MSNLVTSKTFYKYFKEKFSSKDIDKEINIFEIKIKDLDSNLLINKDFIENYTKYTLDEILCLTTSNLITGVYFNSNDIKLIAKCKYYLRLRLLYLNKLKRLTKKKPSINKIDFRVYAFVLNEFNKEVINYIINGGIFNVGFNISYLYMKERNIVTVRDGSPVLRIDWGTSYKFKNKLIAEGKLPLENYKNEDNVIIGNNGGIAWLHYHKIKNFWFYWDKYNSKIPNRLIYSFTPSFGIKRLLSDKLKDNPEIEIKYSRNASL